MENYTDDQKINRLHECCRNYRGALLHSYTILEDIMDQVISVYFVGYEVHRKSEFIGILLSSEAISWHNKKKMVDYIVGVICPELKSTTTHPKTLSNRLGDIITERNIIAHRTYGAIPSMFPEGAKIEDHLPVKLSVFAGGKAGMKLDQIELNESVVKEKQTEVFLVGVELEKVLDKIVEKINTP